MMRFGRVESVKIGAQYIHRYHAPVIDIAIAVSKVEQFFGRAYVRMADLRTAESAMRSIRAHTEPLKLGGEILMIEPLYYPASSSPSLYIGNVRASESVAQDLTLLFAQFGAIHSVSESL